MATGCTGDVWECKKVWRERHKVLCAKCVEVAAEEFRFEDELECVGEFVYLGDMLNDTGEVEQAVAARVKAAWMKFREFGGILCKQEASLRIKVLCIRHVFTAS